jgi:two-component system LytT family response regulator
VTASVLRALIVDDEAPARRKVARLLRRHDDVEIIGEAADAAEAVDRIRAERPDLVFLDVQMPGADGFSVVEAIADDPRAPRIVFVTAHDRYAVRAFDVCAADYLLKPFDEERFDRALDRVRAARPADDAAPERLRELLEAFRGAATYPERLLVPGEDRSFFVAVDDIVRVEAARNSVVLHCGNRTFALRTTMEALERRLDPRRFARLNRSHLVRIDAIAELEPWFHGEYKVRLRDGTLVTWSRRYVGRRPDLLQRL